MSSETWTIRKVLTWTTGHFEKRQVDAPRLTAEMLLSYVLKTTRV
ncbi:MAG TPA: peptide chain release factor N(5)-glutamine methyltransferase, partial [Myxococcaceae bacterium]